MRLIILRLLIIICVAHIGGISLSAQSLTVNGKVTDEEGAPLPGATVLIKGTSTGIVSDVDGKYKINVQRGDILVFSFVGMVTQESTVTEQTTIDISMKTDFIALSEVVVIGYGTARKSDLTGAVASVNSKELQKIATPNLLKSMQGQVAGVSVETSNGSQPGGGISIKIRGSATLTNTLPLYVVDGIIVSDISTTNQSDIESMEILKDASACAVYGSRAANGVVLITTKKGKSGETRIDFNAYVGMQTPTKYLERANLEEYHQINADVIGNSATAQVAPINDPLSSYYVDSIDTDWQDLMLNPALTQNYSLSLSGGNKNSTYYISGSYSDQNGILLGTGYKALTAKVNSTTSKGRFSFGENLSLSRNYTDFETWGGAGRGVIVEMLKMTPNFEPVDETQLGGYGANIANITGHAASNVYGGAYLIDNHQNGYIFAGNAFGSFEFFEGLKYTLKVGGELRNNKFVYHLPVYYMGTEDNNLESPSLQENHYQNYLYIIENLVNFDRIYGKHSINAVLGFTYQENNYQNTTLSTNGLASNDIYQIGAGNPDAANISSFGSTSSLVSYLGRIIYSYNSRYLLTATYRRDGSSKFSPANKFGNFPSVSAGWNLHNENFFPLKTIIDLFKIRASWGKLGMQEIGDYRYAASINSNAAYVFGNGQDFVPGATQLSFVSEDFKWEETTTSNIGIDLGFFRNKLTATFDYFSRYTTDMLVEVPLPPSSGAYPASILRNYGEIESKGTEFSLSFRKSEGVFHYAVTGNITTEKTEVIRLGSENPLWGGEYETGEGNTQKTMAGGGISDFYLFHVEGIFQSQEEIDAYNKSYTDQGLPIPQLAAAPGDIRFQDVDKNGILDNIDKIYAGSPVPKFYGGLNFTADYRNFDFTMFWYGTYGNKIVNGSRFWTESMSTNYNSSKACLNRWTETNPSNTMPRAIQGDPNGNTKPSDRWLEDGSYLRLKNLELGYTMSDKILNKVKMSSLRLYISAQNLITFTKYKGYDPELGGSSDGRSTYRGVDRRIYPTAKTLLIGCQLSF